jgi:hypothetical protein
MAGNPDAILPGMDLFEHALQERMLTEAPLAARMRPRTLDEFISHFETISAALAQEQSRSHGYRIFRRARLLKNAANQPPSHEGTKKHSGFLESSWLGGQLKDFSMKA